MASPTPNEQRVTAHAEQHGWHVHNRNDLQTTVEYRKRGSGYVLVAFGLNGHVRWAATPSRPLRGTAAVTDWLASH
jgi:hypothetical protein